MPPTSYMTPDYPRRGRGGHSCVVPVQAHGRTTPARGGADVFRPATLQRRVRCSFPRMGPTSRGRARPASHSSRSTAAAADRHRPGRPGGCGEPEQSNQPTARADAGPRRGSGSTGCPDRGSGRAASCRRRQRPEPPHTPPRDPPPDSRREIWWRHRADPMPEHGRRAEHGTRSVSRRRAIGLPPRRRGGQVPLPGPQADLRTTPARRGGRFPTSHFTARGAGFRSLACGPVDCLPCRGIQACRPSGPEVSTTEGRLRQAAATGGRPRNRPGRDIRGRAVGGGRRSRERPVHGGESRR